MDPIILDEATLQHIDQQLPDLSNVQGIVLGLAPDFISMKFDPDNYVPVAAVCIQDTLNSVAEARYALHETLANLIRYREKRQPADEYAAVFLGKFYVDDAALRLYSAGEHLANAIILMLEIEDEQLKPYEQKRTSQQSIVAAFLRKEARTHPVTPIILKLGKSSNWNKAINYRNTWVHDQPPTVHGTGIVYKRYRRWKASEGGESYSLGIGGGDEPQYSVDDILGFVQPALFEFVETLEGIVQQYLEILKSRGIEIRPDQRGLQSTL